ncbi:NAD(P)/FAD-dependent oxidoreductase [Candidatus Formimonas warabiya]|uniref:FAD/NAD(P)-binding oxidoreductase n=1 Tax=Formimonas warabiya TaxID=1761012 RepID=A0A3G1L0T8_FORW1|nr:NAD(P)/FAD-dependent oxidoreductase [Candidatus Formimonas warabiya]ATW28268.1 FAD/NAD(P)-binding oxidoreductase [Candidatus Formimonas warabiya]
MIQQFDVIVIGGGVIGSAISRELSRYKLKIGVLEKELDVACETSGRNSGVVHSGFNNKPGTLMAKFCVEGCLGFKKVAGELDLPFKRTGKLIVGFTRADLDQLEEMKEQGDRNGTTGLRILSKKEIKQIEPNIEGEAALYSPMTGIVNPFIFNIALAENACQNGVKFFFNNEVRRIKRIQDYYALTTPSGTYRAKWVINSAGLYADRVAEMAGVTGYQIYPCRGEYFVLDKEASQYLKIPVYPVPNRKAGGRGIHLTPTTDGNVLIGPSVEYIEEKDDYATTQDAIDMLIRAGTKLLPRLKKEYFIRNFAGVRPKLVDKETGGSCDFVIIEKDVAPGMINLIGMESPGLTSAVPLAREIVDRIRQKEILLEKDDFNPCRKGILCFQEQPDEIKAQLIKENPNYGEIICRCEHITKQEILEAVHNPLGVDTIVGMKNRTRAMMGRCQGGFCQSRIAEIILQEKGKNADDIMYARTGGKMFYGSVRP